jgi:hypothetical protein
MSGEWADQFREVLTHIAGRVTKGDGFPLQALEKCEARLGLQLPQPLRDYYLSVGRNKINSAHNRLRTPDTLEVQQRRLVFMEENQWVVYWGVPTKTAAADPMVFQSMDPEAGDWTSESKCSQFLSAMLCWQAVSGGSKYIGYSDTVPASVARRVTRDWTSVGRIRELTAFVNDEHVACVIKEGQSATLHVGCRKRGDLEKLSSAWNVVIQEA